MPSHALLRWQTARRHRLDQLEAAHRAVGGVGRGRRVSLDQLDDAYLVQVAAQWQGFCRDLHTEAADAIASAVQPPSVAIAVREAFTQNRSLDRGNATAGSVGNDFGRFGAMQLWPRVFQLDGRNRERRRKLDQLNVWRNAVAHQDFPLTAANASVVAGTQRTLVYVRRWRSACDHLATHFDRAVRDHIITLVGTAPWS